MRKINTTVSEDKFYLIMKKALFIILFSIGIDSVLAQQGLISISKTEKETAVAVDTKLTKIAAFPGGQNGFFQANCQ